MDKYAKATKSLLKALFPKARYKKYSKGVYVACSRFPKNSSQKAVFDKEVAMAKHLASCGYTIYFLPEPGNSSHSNPDCVVQGLTCELKDVTGNITMVGKRYKEALKQADSVFLKTRAFKKSLIYAKFVGTTKVILQNGRKINDKGFVYLWIEGEAGIVEWNIKDIVKDSLKKSEGLPSIKRLQASSVTLGETP